MFKLLEKNYFGFKNEETNNQFNLWQYKNSIKQIKYILALTGTLYILMGIVNLFILKQELHTLVIFIQLFLIPSYSFLISFLAYKKINFKTLETLLVLAPIFASSLHVFVFMNLDTYSSYQTELYLMIFWTFTISGLRFHKAIIAGFFVLIVGETYPYLTYHNQQNEFILHTSWMIISILFGTLGGFLFHQSKKATFTKELELQKMATVDKLTGLYNRVKLDSVLIHELERAKRYNQNIGILLLDIDYFKNVNDTYGHLVGDQVLIAFSKKIQKHIRRSDYLFRWGGEEFLLICLEINQTDIIILSEKIRKEIEQEVFENIGHATISIGSTISSNIDTVESIIHRADEALYEAKETGRNKVCYK